MSILNETPLPGTVPRYEVPGWRQRLNVAAGITGRGTRRQPFDLGLGSRQPVGEVMGRWRELRGAESGFRTHVLGNQVHGREVRRQEAGDGWVQVPGVDGHITSTPGVMLYVTVADCIPVYLVAPGKAVGLLHAGWRGTAAGILERGIEAVCQHSDATLHEVVMHCGIGICGDCYEVGHEVLDALGCPSSEPPHHVDIREVLATQAARLGVTEVSRSSRCSSHEGGEFFSHRRSVGQDGRMVAYLGMLP